MTIVYSCLQRKIWLWRRCILYNTKPNTFDFPPGRKGNSQEWKSAGKGRNCTRTDRRFSKYCIMYYSYIHARSGAIGTYSSNTRSTIQAAEAGLYPQYRQVLPASRAGALLPCLPYILLAFVSCGFRALHFRNTYCSIINSIPGRYVRGMYVSWLWIKTTFFSLRHRHY